MFVAYEKIPVNFTIPDQLKDVFDAVAEPFGGKQKWAVISAALVLLANTAADDREDLIGEVLRADGLGRIEELIKPGAYRVLAGRSRASGKRIGLAAKHRPPENTNET